MFAPNQSQGLHTQEVQGLRLQVTGFGETRSPFRRYPPDGEIDPTPLGKLNRIPNQINQQVISLAVA